ncbi:MAG: DPP IV N-terminal domain-containing protein [Anaerolineae bacterium]|nr:DPP IV N-terminal domain-containing protein [Anaerolineae bacterium]
MKPKRLLILAILLALVTAALPVASAQEPPKPTLAYIKGGNLWLRYDNNTDAALTDDAGRVVGNAAYPAYYEPRYAQPRWSPDGKWLAVVRIDRAGRTLYLADVTQPEIRLEPVVGGLGIAFPPAWNAELAPCLCRCDRRVRRGWPRDAQRLRRLAGGPRARVAAAGRVRLPGRLRRRNLRPGGGPLLGGDGEHGG